MNIYKEEGRCLVAHSGHSERIKPREFISEKRKEWIPGGGGDFDKMR